MNVTIKFLGAAQTVTGSKYLLDFENFQVLVDCGLFQGSKKLRQRNWDEFPFAPADIDALVLTHAHIDHLGYLPRLVKDGFHGSVYCTSATADLARIMLLDSAKIQEEEAKYANKKGYSKHEPAEPLYTVEDAEATFALLRDFEYDEDIPLHDGVSIKFHDAGHILGSSWVEMNVKRERQRKTLVFSGDVGRYHQPVLRSPVSIGHADVLLVESTYGDRENDAGDPASEFAEAVNTALSHEGCVLIPSFAVGRTQTVMYYLKTLMESGEIPKVPVYLDSPMAINVTQLYKRRFTYHKLRDQDLQYAESLFDYEFFNYYQSVEASKSINDLKRNAIIISSSGMCTGGRILHHLVQRLPRQEDTILFVGYQAKGTRGRSILEKQETIRMFGQNIPLRCHVTQIAGLSGHADRSELRDWVDTLNAPPQQTFVVHGELESATAMQQMLQQDLGWDQVYVPDYLDEFTLFEK